MEKTMQNQVEILEYATRESLMLGGEGGAGSILGREENCYDKKALSCVYIYGSFPKEGYPNIDPKIL